MFKQRWQEKEFEKHVNNEVVKRLEASGFIVEGEIKRVIIEKGLIDEGTFLGSITHEIRPAELKVLIGSPITNPPYPWFLEFGTLDKREKRAAKGASPWDFAHVNIKQLTGKGIPPYAPMRTGLAKSKRRVQAVWK